MGEVRRRIGRRVGGGGVPLRSATHVVLRSTAVVTGIVSRGIGRPGSLVHNRVLGLLSPLLGLLCGAAHVVLRGSAVIPGLVFCGLGGPESRILGLLGLLLGLLCGAAHVVLSGSAVIPSLVFRGLGGPKSRVLGLLGSTNGRVLGLVSGLLGLLFAGTHVVLSFGAVVPGICFHGLGRTSGVMFGKAFDLMGLSIDDAGQVPERVIDKLLVVDVDQRREEHGGEGNE